MLGIGDPQQFGHVQLVEAQHEVIQGQRPAEAVALAEGLARTVGRGCRDEAAPALGAADRYDRYDRRQEERAGSRAPVCGIDETFQFGQVLLAW
ncbi:hypothetical protein OG313_41630 [Streptomyces virginiae]|nr:hypothetical protein [Streptomyces virginiae]